MLPTTVSSRKSPGESVTVALGANGIKEFARKHKVKSKVGEEIKSRLPTFRRYRLSLSLAGSRKKERSFIHHDEKRFSGFVYQGKVYGIKIAL